MIDVLPSPHSAIFNTPPRRLPPSLIAAFIVAVGVHGLLAFYLITQGFQPVTVPEDPPTTIDDPIVIVMRPDKPVENPKPQPPVIPVHKTVYVPETIDTVPIIPTKGPDITSPELPVLPTVVDPPQPLDNSGTQTGPVYVEPRWTRFPDADTLSSYYPPAAIEDNVTGSATVECTVLDTAGRVSCTVVSETPRRAGFGKATAAMIAAVGRVDTTQGDVRPGSVLRKTVTWTLAD